MDVEARITGIQTVVLPVAYYLSRDLKKFRLRNLVELNLDWPKSAFPYRTNSLTGFENVGPWVSSAKLSSNSHDLVQLIRASYKSWYCGRYPFNDALLTTSFSRYRYNPYS